MYCIVVEFRLYEVLGQTKLMRGDDSGSLWGYVAWHRRTFLVLEIFHIMIRVMITSVYTEKNSLRYTQLFTTVLFVIIAQKRERLKWPSIGEWLKKQWYIHTA